MTCPIYTDGQHCFVPGALRTIAIGSEPIFADWSSVCADDAEVKAAKLCHCGALVTGDASVRAYPKPR